MAMIRLRFPCGKLRGPTRAQMEQARAAVEQASKAQVIAQPHRNGDESDMAASELGRLIKRHVANGREKPRIERDIYSAANAYAVLVMKWRRAKGIPMTQCFDLPGFNGGETDPKKIAKMVAELRERINELDRAMRVAGNLAWASAVDLMLDDYPPRVENERVCFRALLMLEEAIRDGG